MIRVAAIALMLAAGPVAAQDPVFDPEQLVLCLEAARDTSGDDCIGVGLNTCMDEHDPTWTNMGVSFCAGEEGAWWDARLNDWYQMAMEGAERADAEVSQPLPQAQALREMQRAWMAYRDAACAFDATQWQGGTGASPAWSVCYMQETAKQALRLRAALAFYE